MSNWISGPMRSPSEDFVVKYGRPEDQMHPVLAALRAGPEDDEEDPNEGLGDDLG